jgi:hypothetical protein
MNKNSFAVHPFPEEAGMAGAGRLLLAAMALAGVLSAPRAHGQQPAAQATAATASPAEPEILRTLPHPPDQPASLLAPPTPPGLPPPALPGPYFEYNPLTDPDRLPTPGAFTDLEIAVLKPHLKNQLFGRVVNPATGNTDTVGLPAATLDWAVSPHVALGWRLPSGFGELSLGYRELASQGTNTAAGTDGPTQLRSRLDFHVIDLDYGSPEFSLWWVHWGMRVRFGLRTVLLYFDSRSDEALALAAAGSGVFQTQTSNSFKGFGPHVGLDLSRPLGWGGLTFLGQLDLTTDLGRIRQTFVEKVTTPGPIGQPLRGETLDSGSEDVPILFTRLGLAWRPAEYPGVQVFVGYQFEYWPDAGDLKKDATVGDFFDQGLVLRAAWNY